jgi:hypothetical protein
MSDNNDLPGSADVSKATQPGLRVLELAVYIMGGVLVLMVFGFVGGVIWKLTHRSEPRPPATQELNLGLPDGSEVRTMQVDGDRLVLDVGREVIVIDTRRNLVLNRISLGAK